MARAIQMEGGIVTNMENKVKKPKAKKENHKQRAYLNSITSVLDSTVKQLTGFFVSPFIVRGLGDSLYGVYHILLDTTSYANMADIRTSQVLKWTIAQKRDILPDEELRSEFTTGMVLTLFLIPIVLLIGGVISWYAPVITNVDEEYYEIVRIASLLMIFSVVMTKLMDLFESVLRGMNLGFKGMGVRSGLLISGGLMKIFAILQGYGLIGLSVVQVLIGILTGGIFYWLVKRNVPWFGLGKTNKSKVLSYSKLSGWFMATMLANMLLFHSEKILLGIIIGPELVTIYVLTLFTSTAMKSMVDAVISGIVPGIGNFFGKGEFDKILKSKKIIHSLIWWCTFAIGTSILLYNQSFLLLWVGEDKYAGNFENLLIALIAIQYIFFSTSGNFINVTLDLKTKVLLIGLAAIITIGLAFVLVKPFGILGMCISILLGRLVLTIGFPRFLKKKINDTTSILTTDNIRPLIVTLGALFLAAMIQDQISVESWILLFTYGALTTLVLAALFWIIGLNYRQKLLLKQTISQVKIFKIKD
jgi:O-antigen/teichoic acid export membrane protein